MAASVQELKDIIVELKMDKIKMSVPQGHCPYAYYRVTNPLESCDETDCDYCTNVFLNIMRQMIVEEVNKL